eukprot:scaffold189956_cov43-Prasinocladus_malaysianus.AAC.3
MTSPEEAAERACRCVARYQGMCVNICGLRNFCALRSGSIYFPDVEQRGVQSCQPDGLDCFH